MSDPLRRLLFALALRIGCTVDELGHRLSAAELRDWATYADLGDPWFDLSAESKADLRTGVIGATLANLLGNGKKRFKPSDFAPQWTDEKPKRRQTPDEMRRAAQKLAAAFANRGK